MITFIKTILLLVCWSGAHRSESTQWWGGKTSELTSEKQLLVSIILGGANAKFPFNLTWVIYSDTFYVREDNIQASGRMKEKDKTT